MANVLIRNLSEKTVARLKKRAKQNKRSLQAELQMILEREAEVKVPAKELSPAERYELAARIRQMLGEKERASTTDLLAEDRQR
jgi:plasmid stability protein